MSLFQRYKEGAKGKPAPEQELDKADHNVQLTLNPLNHSTPSTEEFSTKPPIYGIEDAVKLIRSLPNGQEELIIQVVKQTLESTNIKISDIILDAERKESQIEKRTRKLRSEIEEFQTKIDRRNEEIQTMYAKLKESIEVKKQLQKVVQAEEKAQPAAAQGHQVKTSATTTESTSATAATSTTHSTATTQPTPRRESA